MKSCLTAQIRFLLFKGPGSFKKFFLNLRKCGVIEGLSIDTTHTPPLFSFYTTFNVPLMKMREVIFLRANYLIGYFKGYFEGAKIFMTKGSAKNDDISLKPLGFMTSLIFYL
jgi:hypothetical protein